MKHALFCNRACTLPSMWGASGALHESFCNSKDNFLRLPNLLCSRPCHPQQTKYLKQYRNFSWWWVFTATPIFCFVFFFYRLNVFEPQEYKRIHSACWALETMPQVHIHTHATMQALHTPVAKPHTRAHAHTQTIQIKRKYFHFLHLAQQQISPHVTTYSDDGT